MAASGTGAPAPSLTAPVIEPLVLCPSPVVAVINTSARAGSDLLERNRLIISASLLCIWKVLLLIAALDLRMSENGLSAVQSRQSDLIELWTYVFIENMTTKLLISCS